MQTDFDSAIAEYGFTSRQQYEQCLSDVRDKISGLNDLEWGDIIEKYNLTIASDTLRKASSTIFGGKFVAEYYRESEKNNASYAWQLNELRKEKQKLADERTALRKLSRDASRVEQDLEYMATLIKENAYPVTLSLPEVVDRGNDLIVMLSDIHLGANVDNHFGTYNAELSVKRMGKYLAQVLQIQDRHGSQNVHVVLLGDLISGNIHSTVQLQNRENVVEQIQKVSELVAAFVFQLSKRFSEVYVNSISGNHSRIGIKDSVLRDERLDDLVIWYLKAKCENLVNVEFVDKVNLDPTIGRIYVRGKEYLAVHGDFDQFSEAGVSKLVMMTGVKPEAILLGHLHHCSYDDVAGVKIIRSGSFADPIDDYSISKRISGHASQMVVVCDEAGVQALYPVDLSLC